MQCSAVQRLITRDAYRLRSQGLFSQRLKMATCILCKRIGFGMRLRSGRDIFPKKQFDNLINKRRDQMNNSVEENQRHFYAILHNFASSFFKVILSFTTTYL